MRSERAEGIDKLALGRAYIEVKIKRSSVSIYTVSFGVDGRNLM
jgi:hypothetical protein